jgi:uncharacterized SAM-dependent methyltransferase
MSDNAGMPTVAHVRIHASQFPDAVRRDLLHSLHTRQVNHKFHYDSVKQTQKWLALHQAHSPSRNDPECAAVYNDAIAAAVADCCNSSAHVLGLGCGGGQKDTRLLKQLLAAGRQVSYAPCDVSAAMVLVARDCALKVLPGERCVPIVCDLLGADDLPKVIESFEPAESARLITFFGMIPNFEPGLILPKLSGLLRAKDLLLFSANLAPGPDYAAGVQRVLPQYDNVLTRDWLMAFLLDLGVETGDGEIQFSVREHPPSSGLLRVEADFKFTSRRWIEIEVQRFEFQAGQTIRLFFSYRYTPQLVVKLLREQGIAVRGQWLTTSGEEGVFLCGRQ